MSGLFELSGRHALVTGASSGLGRHFALVLAKAGATVTVVARRPDELAKTVAAVEAAGGRARAVVMDVTDASDVERALDDAEAGLGVVTVLVNSAGVANPKPALELTEADWDAVVDTNLKGVWLVTRGAGLRMVRGRTGGSIVNVASIAGLRAFAGGMPYGASKAGVAHMTHNLALEWAEHGIRVNALAPGFFRTEMNEAFLTSDAGKAHVQHYVPQRRTGRLEELDGPLLLLASDAGSFMTGSVVVVDGGNMVSSL